MNTEKRDKNQIFPPGQMRLPSINERKSHDSVSISEAFKAANFLNTARYLQEHFINSGSVFSTECSGYLIKTIRPISPFGYGGLMTFASPKEIEIPVGVNPEEFIFETKSIYDFPIEVQREYFKQIFATLRAFQTTHLPNKLGEKHKPIVIENSMHSVSTEKHHMGRSIALPHSHIMTASDLWIDNNHRISPPFRRATEQRILANELVFNTFCNFILKQDSIFAKNNIRLLHRAIAPFGYTLATDILINNDFSGSIDTLTQIMNSNHYFYLSFLNSYWEEIQAKRAKCKFKKHPEQRHKTDILLPQPSYRVFFYVNEGRLQITISPVLIDSGGAIEASNMTIYRSPTVPSIYSDTELSTFHNLLSIKLLGDLIT